MKVNINKKQLNIFKFRNENKITNNKKNEVIILLFNSLILFRQNFVSYF